MLSIDAMREPQYYVSMRLPGSTTQANGDIDAYYPVYRYIRKKG
jgi:hypothetical protein